MTEDRKTFMIILLAGLLLSGIIFFFVTISSQPKEYPVVRELKEIIPLLAEEENQVQSSQDTPVPQQQTPPEPASIPMTEPPLPKEQGGIQALLDKLGDDDITVCQEAADTLAQKGDEAVPSLIEALSEATVGLKGQVIFLLGRIGSEEAVPALVEVLDNEENAYLRRNAAESLGKIRNGSALSTLTTSLYDEDTSVRQRSAWALGQLDNTVATGYLLGALNDERQEGVKVAIVGSLKVLKDQAATETLLSELKSENDLSYKNEVVMALGEIKDIRAVDELKEYLGRLKQYEPEDEIIKHYIEESIKTAEEAIEKIENSQGLI